MSESSKPSIGDVLKPFAEFYATIKEYEREHDDLHIYGRSCLTKGKVKVVTLTVEHFREAAEMYEEGGFND